MVRHIWRGVFLGGQPRHCICTDASRGLSATTEFLVFLAVLASKFGHTMNHSLPLLIPDWLFVPRPDRSVSVHYPAVISEAFLFFCFPTMFTPVCSTVEWNLRVALKAAKQPAIFLKLSPFCHPPDCTSDFRYLAFTYHQLLTCLSPPNRLRLPYFFVSAVQLRKWMTNFEKKILRAGMCDSSRFWWRCES